MFTSGVNAGTMEEPDDITKTVEGIRFTVNGLSPVSVAWSAVLFDVNIADTTNGTVRVSSAHTSAGTQVTVTATPDSGYRLSTLTVTDAAGNSCSLGAANDDTYVFTMPAASVTVKATFVSKTTAIADTTNPKTGDDFHILFWSGMMMTAMLGAAALLLNRKKFFMK
jgi:LPXTG-motif cell wall-anchored protein